MISSAALSLRRELNGHSLAVMRKIPWKLLEVTFQLLLVVVWFFFALLRLEQRCCAHTPHFVVWQTKLCTEQVGLFCFFRPV